MKKTSLLLAVAGIAVVTMTSCKKQQPEKLPETETINTNVKGNETYSFVLPVSDSPEPYEVVKQNSNSGTSIIEKDGDGNFVYKYTPIANFSGTDVIVISNVKERHGNCDHHNGEKHEDAHEHPKLFHHGDCIEHKPQKHIITFNFTVNGITTDASTISSK